MIGKVGLTLIRICLRNIARGNPFSAKEIKDAVFQLGPVKASGPIGFPAVFFQRYWDIVGSAVITTVLSFLNSGHLLKEKNFSYIVLVPKVPSPNLKTSDPLSFAISFIKSSPKS